MKSESGEISGWLSPTRVWRLTQCPASAQPFAPAIALVASMPVPNVGSLAHDVVQRWIHSNGFAEASPRAAMARAITDSVIAIGNAPPAAWAISKARILARAAELAAILTSQAGARVISEQTIEDPARGLRGTPDLVVLSDQSILLDLKTETLAAGQVRPWVRFQLTIYAHLIAQHYGVIPAQIGIFSLNRGWIPVLISQQDVAVALEAVERAGSADPSETLPELETCRFCRRRLVCEPHWTAALARVQADCVEGTIEHIDNAANGLSAIRIRSLNGEQWVGGIPSAVVVAADVGSAVRIVRVYGGKMERGEKQWRWTSSSTLALT